MAEHLNTAVLDELKEIMGEDFSLLIETFIKDSDLRIQQLLEAVSANDAQTIREVAHSFKGSAGNLAAQQLSALCERLEHAARNGSLGDAESMLAAIETEYAIIRELVRSF